MLQFLGSDPSSHNEYACTLCGHSFTYRNDDEEEEPKAGEEPEEKPTDPMYCPQCGNA